MSNPNLEISPAWPEIDRRHRDAAVYPAGVAYMDGQYLPMSEAKISILDWGLLHSDATYDTVHVWNGRFFRLDLHLDRFFNGLQKLRLHIGIDRKELQDVLEKCVALSGHQSAYVEMICTRGMSPTLSRDPRNSVNRFIAFAVPFGSVANPEQMKRGLHVAVSQTVRIPPASVDPTIKNYHWLDLIKGLFDAYDQNAETALLLDYKGDIAEGPGFNVFVVKDGRIKTPGENVLAGITRRSVFDICTELGLPVKAAPVGISELKAADEIFITSTAGGIMPVTRVDGEVVGNADVGPITRRLTEIYWQKHTDPAWSSPISYSHAVQESERA